MPLTGEYEPNPVGWVREQVERYQASGGAEANTLRDTGIPIILITCRGRTSGKLRTFALMRVEHDGEYALVASKGGMPNNPAWVNNLETYPDDVVIQDGADRFGVHVRLVEGDERQVWWERAVAAYPDYETYRANTDRHIPVYVATRD